jgi:hypothetical protein
VSDTKPAWQPYPGGTAQDYWLDLEFGRRPETNTPPELRASVKSDGCIHLYSYLNAVDPASDSREELEPNTEYLHICQLEDHIKALQDLLAKAREHFGDWPR